ncbi:putative sugar transporter [Aspergillus pseudoustus]|uniref:Sugar transporter n=1 Tax=Aspergillus pseudoustus TaxID=1810923 RepID=A0ABR4IWN6_9EURO
MAHKQKISTYNLLVVLAAALGSFTFGFTVNVTGPVLGMPTFYDYFDLDIEQTTGVIGAIPACYFGGGIVGAALGAWTSEVLGRRRALFLACILGVIGGVLIGSAVNIVMLLLGRLLSGLCSGYFQTIVPIYQSEVSPASRRGHLVGQHGFFLVLGGTTAVFAGLGCSFSANEQLQWRLALALSGLPPLVLAPALFWLPESPRWLMARGRFQQALRVLQELHKTPSDPDNSLAASEFTQIKEQLELEKTESRTVLSALREPSMRKRLVLATLTPFNRGLLQCSGVLVIITYQVILYENLGITGWRSILLLGIYNLWSAVGNYFNARMIDRVGRKRLLFWGLLGALVALSLYTAMVARYAGTANRVGCGFGVLFVYLYTTFYGFCLDVTCYVYCAEIFPTYMRPAGMAVSIISYFAPALLFAEVAPTAFRTIEWKFYLVFILVPACGLPVIWFYFPETRGLTLEEVAGLACVRLCIW